MIKYRTRVIEQITHGARSSSALIKTIGGGVVVPPTITCTPTATTVFSAPGLNHNVGPQMRRIEERKYTLDVSINDEPFVTHVFYNPMDFLTILMTGRLNQWDSLIDGVDKETVVTALNPELQKMPYLFPFMIPTGDETDEVISREEQAAIISRMSAMMMDVFGLDITSDGINDTLMPIAGYDSNGAFIGKTKTWTYAELFGGFLNNIYPSGLYQNPASNKITFRRGTGYDDCYDAVVQNAEQDTCTMMSCSTTYFGLPAMTCIPTKHTFKPTITPASLDCEGFALSMTFVNRGGNMERAIGGNDAIFVATTETDPDHPDEAKIYDFGDVRTKRTTLITTDDDALTVFLSLPDTNKIPGIKTIGDGYNSANVRCVLDPSTGNLTLSGMFDEYAIEGRRTPYQRYNVIVDNEDHEKSVEQEHCEVTFNVIAPEGLPAGLKCYVTEQFGEPVHLTSCLAMHSRRNMAV